MVTKKQIKLVKSLQQKKYRTQHGLFVAEGIKTVSELLDAGLKPFEIFTTLKKKIFTSQVEMQFVSESDLNKMTALKTSNGVLGVFNIPEVSVTNDSDWVLVLDAVRDPGNLGTIIRLCDWFNVGQLVCSTDTVDCYNPKVLQATMGSIARVNIIYEDLEDYITASKLPVFGAFMDGDSVYMEELPEKGILVMGNEASGISKYIENVVEKKISIPQFGKPSTESLNVATATGILLNEIRRGLSTRR